MKRIILILVVFAAVFFAAWYFLFGPGEEDRIRRQFDKLAKTVSKESGESALVIAVRNERLSALFDDSCTVIVPETPFSGDYSPLEISSKTIRARTRFNKITLDFHDLSVEITDPQTASATLTVYFKGLSKHGELIEEAREVNCKLVKKQDTWLFREFSAVQVLEK